MDSLHNPNDDNPNAGKGGSLRLLKVAGVHFSLLSFFKDIKSWLSSLK